MRPSEAARLAGVSPDTIRRWLEDYAEFFTHDANPGENRERNLTIFDQRLVLLIANLRKSGLYKPDIITRLEESRSVDYKNLPPLPDQGTGSIRQDLAASRASEMVESAVLKRDLSYVRQELSQSQEQVKALEADLQEARATEQGHTGRIHELEVALERARGELAALQARLEGYAFGGSRPIAPALLIMAALGIGAVLMLIAFVVIRLIG